MKHRQVIILKSLGTINRHITNIKCEINLLKGKKRKVMIGRLVEAESTREAYVHIHDEIIHFTDKLNSATNVHGIIKGKLYIIEYNVTIDKLIVKLTEMDDAIRHMTDDVTDFTSMIIPDKLGELNRPESVIELDKDTIKHRLRTSV